MIPRSLTIGAVAIAIVALVVWRYGEARYSAGYAEAAVAQAHAAIKLQQRLDEERRAAAERLAAISAALQTERRKHDATLTNLRARDETFRAWHDGVIHPVGADLIWLPDAPAGNGGRLPGGPIATLGLGDAVATAESADVHRARPHKRSVAPKLGGRPGFAQGG